MHFKLDFWYAYPTPNPCAQWLHVSTQWPTPNPPWSPDESHKHCLTWGHNRNSNNRVLRDDVAPPPPVHHLPGGCISI